MNIFLSLLITIPLFCFGTGGAHTFSKVGDSITVEHFYLYPVGNPNELVLDKNTGGLYPTIQYFGSSFGRESKAAVSGYRTYDLLQPNVNCDNKTFLECEYDEQQPRYALIMVGTNDPPNWLDEGFSEVNLRKIIAYTQGRGIIPILFTIPPNESKDVIPFNSMVKKVANESGVFLVDYYAEMMKLPNLGLREDGVHPNVPPTGSAAQLNDYGLQYGYPVRNLLTLRALEFMRKTCDPKWQVAIP